MPKRVFWPATLVVMGLIYMASNMGFLPVTFWNLWPLILVLVGLGGLITSDREEWIIQPKSKKAKGKKAKIKVAVQPNTATKICLVATMEASFREYPCRINRSMFSTTTMESSTNRPNAITIPTMLN